MLDAMSAGALIIASKTAPVEEVVADGQNGIIFDFFDVKHLAQSVVDALAHQDRYKSIRAAARQTVLDRYDLKRVCLPAWLRLLDATARHRR